MRQYLNQFRRESRAGFTAIEVAAVATIISIMALVLIPIVRNRVEEARKTAAMDDMAGIEKAESIAYGYTGLYFRLHDLPRPESTENPPAGQEIWEYWKLPRATWNQPLGSFNFATVVANWKGPFVSYHNTRSLSSLFTTHPVFFRSPDGTGPNNGGPILVTEEDLYDQFGGNALDRIQYPIDPWGNPYVFFGQSYVGTVGNPAIPAGSQLNYSTAAVFSLGPDGVPGTINDGAWGALDLYREPGRLGRQDSDDFRREF